MITLDDVTLGYPTGRSESAPWKPVLRHLSFVVESTEIVGVCGRSGSGKSTLLKGVAGLLKPQEGRIWPEGAKKNGRLWYLPQRTPLVDFRTVLQNIFLAREALRPVTEQDLAEARTLALDLGLSDALQKLPAQLSGGMRRRTALGQALFSEATTLLCDEPLAELDPATRNRAEDLIFSNVRARARTLLLASHDLDSLVALADWIVVLPDTDQDEVRRVQVLGRLAREATPSQRRSSPSFRACLGEVHDALVG